MSDTVFTHTDSPRGQFSRNFFHFIDILLWLRRLPYCSHHRAAQFEHEVLITETGAEVITVPN